MKRPDDLLGFIEQANKAVEYGIIQFTIKKHDGLITSIDANKNSQFKLNDSVEALAMVGTLLKAVQARIIEETKYPVDKYTAPSLSFTIFFNKKGQADRIHVNDFSRQSLEDMKYT